MSVKAAFALPEVFEAILSYLPFDELLDAQLVCKEWRSYIASSYRLRRILFLHPVAQPKPRDVGLSTNTHALISLESPQIHPILAMYSTTSTAVGGYRGCFDVQRYRAWWRRYMNHQNFFTIVASIKGQSESMFVTQPPTQNVFLHPFTKKATSKGIVKVEGDEHGVRLGDLKKAMTELLGGKVGTDADMERWREAVQSHGTVGVICVHNKEWETDFD